MLDCLMVTRGLGRGCGGVRGSSPDGEFNLIATAESRVLSGADSTDSPIDECALLDPEEAGDAGVFVNVFESALGLGLGFFIEDEELVGLISFSSTFTFDRAFFAGLVTEAGDWDSLLGLV